MKMILNYAAEAVLAADGERKPCSNHVAVKVQETMQEQDQDVEVAEQVDGTTIGCHGAS